MSNKPYIMVIAHKEDGTINELVDITHHYTRDEARAHIGRMTGKGQADHLTREDGDRFHVRCSVTGIRGYFEIV